MKTTEVDFDAPTSYGFFKFLDSVRKAQATRDQCVLLIKSRRLNMLAIFEADESREPKSVRARKTIWRVDARRADLTMIGQTVNDDGPRSLNGQVDVF